MRKAKKQKYVTLSYISIIPKFFFTYLQTEISLYVEIRRSWLGFQEYVRGVREMGQKRRTLSKY